MQKLIAKYGTAAHLAFLTVAPLFLFPFFSPDSIAGVLFWLSAPAAIWVVMSPSRRLDETAHGARLRVVRSCLCDPLFWFALFLVVLTGFRWLNTGVDIAYDAESEMWKMAECCFPMLPGSAAGVGLLPFAATVALFVLLAGLRHALGRKARMSFVIMVAVLSGIAALSSVLSISFGNEHVRALSIYDYARLENMGTAFGLCLLGSVVALFGCVELRWLRVELLIVLSLMANAVALLVFAPIATILVFIAAFLLLVVISFLLTRKVLSGTGSLRCALAILLTLIVAGLVTVFAPKQFSVAGKAQDVLALAVFPPDFVTLRTTLSDIAFKAWKEMPWTGSGLGAFPFNIRFFATAADWAVIRPGQVAVPNGWWQLLVERGVIGALSFAIAFGMLLWTYFHRIVCSFTRIAWRPLQALGPIALLALVALTLVDCSLMRADVLLVVCAFLALAASDIPEPKKAEEKKK